MDKKFFFCITSAVFIPATVFNLLIVFTIIFCKGNWAPIVFLIAADCLVCFMYYYLIYRPYIRLNCAVKEFCQSHNLSDFAHKSTGLIPSEFVSGINEVRQHSLDYANAQKQSEYLALQNQINPHFLYNTLEALRGDTLCEGLTTVASVIEALATFFRYTITDTGNLTSLENEIEHAEKYFVIQNYRFENKISMQIKLPENESTPLNYLLPKLTLQPLIENSIFHGLEQKSGTGCITIQIETTSKFLFINISDTGIGMEPEVLHEINKALEEYPSGHPASSSGAHRSIALKNVSRRIKLLFGPEYGLHLYSTPGIGTDVKIILPKIKAKDLNP